VAPPTADPFDWRDGDRLVLFGRGRAGEAAERAPRPFTLMTTARARAATPEFEQAADAVVEVPPGRVDEISAELIGAVGHDQVVAVGGGRVIDVAKAVVAARGAGEVAAVPTTLSAAEMTGFHRQVPGASGFVRPTLIAADPALSASQPDAELAASTLNSLGHALEATVTIRANLVATLVAHEGARRLLAGWRELDGGHTDAHRDSLALGAVLSGYAIDSAGLGLHHVLSQTLARFAGVPHATANAVMLTHTLRALDRRQPRAIAAVGEALGEDPISVAAELAARAGATRLRELGVGQELLGECAERAAERPQLEATPPPADRSEVLALYETAW